MIILSEPTVASYGTIGERYRDTFRAMGLDAVAAPYPSAPPDLPRDAVVLHNTLGFRFEPFRGVRNVAIPFHEWDRYPGAWASRLNHFDEVWAATSYLAGVLRRSGVEVPIRVLPPALDVAPPDLKPTWVARRPFRFLFVGEPHFRKGHHLLIEAYRRLGVSARRATLTLKTSADCGWHVSDPGIHRVATRWSRRRMQGAYATFDAFISASLGEGLGLGVAEAMLAGLPVATNRWGGHTALLVEGGYVRIAHRVVPQVFCSRPDFYAPGQRCAYSSPDAIAHAMDVLLAMSARARAAQARLASATIRDRFGLASCAPRLRAALAA
ncbi:MAG: glycosyltransferase [Vicinamibacterales bacterium]